MKKILFIIPEYTHGGTNKCLENLLSLVDTEKLHISIFCLRKDGYYKSVFKKYNIISSSFIFTSLYNNITFKIIRNISKFIYIPYYSFIFKLETFINPSLKGFDSIIAFQEGRATHFASYLNGRKICWVHCDYNLYIKGVTHPFSLEQNIYKRFDNIVCVSDYTTSTFKSKFPDIKERTTRIYNTLNDSQIRELAIQQIEDMSYGDDCFSIVSIGRMDSVKQFHVIPSIVRDILNRISNANIKWYIIGPESLYTKTVESEIHKYEVEKYVILLGGKNNPYPYIQKANILACTSINEACPYVVNEAKILYKPVISTNYPSAYELIDEKCGRITSIDDYSDALIDLIINKDNCYSNMLNACLHNEYSNDAILDAFYKLINL